MSVDEAGEDILQALGDVTAVNTADVEDRLWKEVRWRQITRSLFTAPRHCTFLMQNGPKTPKYCVQVESAAGPSKYQGGQHFFFAQKQLQLEV